MSAKAKIINSKNIYIYKDCIQDLISLDEKNKSIFIEISDIANFSFNIDSNKNSNLVIEINCKDFENICKEYLKYVKEKS